MHRLRRRTFVRGSLGSAGAAALFSGLFARQASADGYGELVSDPDGILDLPRGFSYRIVETAGDAMDDGYTVPGRGDGMACFDGPDGTWVLMRNHEVSAGDFSNGGYGAGEAPAEAYDEDAYGGVTRVVIDAEAGTRISSNFVLAGTVRNCAGGPSPWGWLSCEEDVSAEHGYVFVCATDAEVVAEPQRVVGFGRMNHEAAAVDPATLVTYLTEDRFDSCFYRFVPDDKSDPFTGTLQALRVVGMDTALTGGLGTVGETMDIDWVDLPDPDPDDDSLRSTAQAAGAAVFSRGEGLWFFEGGVYFSCTNGGPGGLGQIFRLTDGADGGELELLAASNDATVLDFPDNITVSPWGEVFMSEDGSVENFVRVLTPDGTVCDFARNAISDSEMAGVCFSPDGTAMFVNIQEDGLTLMVTGPFPTDGGGDTSGGETDTDEGGDSSSGDVADASSGDGPDPSDTDTFPGTSGETASDTGEGDTDTEGDSAGADDGGDAGCCNVAGGSPASGIAAAGAVALGWALKGGRTVSEQLPAEDDPES